MLAIISWCQSPEATWDVPDSVVWSASVQHEHTIFALSLCRNFGLAKVEQN